jgi:hypothetical protein
LRSFLFKIITSPLLLWLSAVLFDDMEFGGPAEYILLGCLLASAGTLVELIFLRPGMLWFNTVLDWFLYSMLIYSLTPLFKGGATSFISAVSAGLLFTFAEYVLHRYLIAVMLKKARETTGHDPV